jgi:hypothetical protein
VIVLAGVEETTGVGEDADRFGKLEGTLKVERRGIFLLYNQLV